MVAWIGLLFGSFVGSFLNVCIHRLPRNLSVVTPPSRCSACGTQVAWYDNVPVLGWLLLRGRCRWCGMRYGVRYPLIEALVGVATAGVLWACFTHHALWAPWVRAAGGPGARAELVAAALAAAALLCLLYALVVATLIDLEHLIVPDELTKPLQTLAPWLAALCGTNLMYGVHPGAWLVERGVFGDPIATPGRFVGNLLGIGLGASLLLALAVPVARWIYGTFCPGPQRWNDEDHRGFRIGCWWFLASMLPVLGGAAACALLAERPFSPAWCAAVQLAQALFGALVGWWSLFLVGFLGTIAFRRNAMGFGDVKFLAPIGAFLGPIGVLYAFFAAAVVGAIVGIPLRLMGRREIPFIPYLALGSVLALILGPQVHRLLFQ